MGLPIYMLWNEKKTRGYFLYCILYNWNVWVNYSDILMSWRFGVFKNPINECWGSLEWVYIWIHKKKHLMLMPFHIYCTNYIMITLCNSNECWVCFQSLALGLLLTFCAVLCVHNYSQGYWPFLFCLDFSGSYCTVHLSIAMIHGWLAAKTVVMVGEYWIAFLRLWKRALPWLLFLLWSLQFLA